MAETLAPVTIKDDETKSMCEFVDSGPPPDERQRSLIFDSFAKIVGKQTGRQKGRGRRTGQNRGTFVFTWGAGYHGQLGRKFQRGQKKYSAVPLMVETDLVVRQVTCGGLHTALVTEHGDVYTWGDGRKGQLGHPTDTSLNPSPRYVEALASVHIVQIACGASHTLALTDIGHMYSWGWAKFGQTGHGDRQQIKTPKRIDSNSNCKDIVAIACGNKHSMAINKDGVALSWGCGEHGQTGQPRQSVQLTADGDRLVPTVMQELVNAGRTVTSIACGSIHSCLVTDSPTSHGDLFICGFGEYFYPNETQHFFYKPKEIQLPEPVQQVACGQSHNVALSTSGNVYTWGSGEYGQLGCGIKGNINMPRMVLEGKSIAQVGAGRYHSFALSSAGQLYSWGCGENGQLGLNSDENISLPTVVTHILGTVVGQVACGEHHTSVLTSAPWSKLSQDTSEWLVAAKTEQELKKAILKKTHRGLTRKDLGKVKEEMRKWHIQHEKRKKEVAYEEELELQRDIASIHYKETLADSVLKDVDEKVKTMKLPQVQPEETAADDEEKVVKEREGVRLPKVFHKKKASQKSVDRSNVESPYRRASSAAQQNTQHLGATQMTAPFTRTAFLKETATMVRKMKAVVTEKGEATNSRELQRMIRCVFSFRKDYDTLTHTSNQLQKQVEVLLKEQQLLQQSNKLSKETFNECYEQLKGLEMQLNTVTIKIAETSENRRNYELNIAHLKEEDFENFNQLKALRKQNQDNNSFFKKMNELKSQAVEEKEKAEAELEEFHKEILAYQKFVTQQLQQFESILGIVQSQNEKREKSKTIRHEKTRAKMTARIDKLQQEAEAADKEGGVLTCRLTSLDLKMRHFEDSFQKITAATGLTNPEAIVNKFQFKGEIKEQLEAEVEDKQQQIEQLKKDEAEMRQTLTDAKSAFKNESWRDVDIIAENQRGANFKASIGAADLTKVRELIAFSQEGLLSLMNGIEESSDQPQADPVETDEMWKTDQASKIFERMTQGVQVMLEVEAERKRKKVEEKKRLDEELASKVKAEKDAAGFNFMGDINELRNHEELDLIETGEEKKEEAPAS